MVARCYQEAGFDLKGIMGSGWCMTTVGWKNFATKNRQFIEEADLQPGDVIWYGKSSGKPYDDVCWERSGDTCKRS